MPFGHYPRKGSILHTQSQQLNETDMELGGSVWQVYLPRCWKVNIKAWVTNVVQNIKSMAIRRGFGVRAPDRETSAPWSVFFFLVYINVSTRVAGVIGTVSGVQSP